MENRVGRLMDVFTRDLASVGHRYPRAIGAIQNFTLIFVSIGIVALYSSYRRPIWIDEFFQFAWGSYRFNFETVAMIFRSTQDFNLGQTGVYMMVNTQLLNTFGADAQALRAPSLISGLFLLACVSYFFRSKGFGFFWQMIALFAFGAQTFLMYYAGEARPYMPMAASAIGIATYFSTPLSQRVSFVPRFIGWTSCTFGALFHPYVVIYAVSLAIIFAVLNFITVKQQITLHRLLPLLNPPMLVVTILISAILGVLGWGQNRKNFGLDPYEWHAKEYLMNIFTDAHFISLPISGFGLRFFAALLLITLTLTIIPQANGLRVALKLLPPLVLMTSGLLITVLLIYISLSSGFWILSRQWLGSMALVTLGLVWYLATAARAFAECSLRLSRLFSVAIGCVFLFSFVERGLQQVYRLQDYSVQSTELRDFYLRKCAPLAMAPCSPAEPGKPEWGVAEAQFNMIQGGPVWSNFQEFYARYRGVKHAETQP